MCAVPRRELGATACAVPAGRCVFTRCAACVCWLLRPRESAARLQLAGTVFACCWRSHPLAQPALCRAARRGLGSDAAPARARTGQCHKAGEGAGGGAAHAQARGRGGCHGGRLVGHCRGRRARPVRLLSVQAPLPQGAARPRLRAGARAACLGPRGAACAGQRRRGARGATPHAAAQRAGGCRRCVKSASQGAGGCRRLCARLPCRRSARRRARPGKACDAQQGRRAREVVLPARARAAARRWPRTGSRCRR